MKRDSGRPSSDPSPTPAPPGLEGASTKTSWTSRDGSGGSAPPPAETSSERRRKLAFLGIGSAGAAFLLTLLVLALRPKTPPVTPDPVPTVPAASAGATPTGVLPPSLVALKLVGPPGTRVFVDGKQVDESILRGPAMTKIRARVEAPGFEPREDTFVLDGRTEAKVDLAPSAPATTAATTKTSPLTKLGAGGKEGKKDPKDPSGLKLKVDP